MPDRGKELAGFPFIPRPWETCRSFVSYGGQVATEAAVAAACEVLLQTLALNSVNVRRGQKERRGEFTRDNCLCQGKYATLTRPKNSNAMKATYRPRKKSLSLSFGGSAGVRSRLK